EPDRLVAERGEHFLPEQHDGPLVVDQKDGLAAAPRRLLLWRFGTRHLVRLREKDLKHAALARAAAHVDGAAVIGDDAVHRREPEPGTAVGCPGGEEGLEDSLLGRLVHAAPAIAPDETHVPACG